MTLIGLPFRLCGAGTGYTINNAIWFDGAADVLKFTPASDGDLDSWTFSCWVKRHRFATGTETILAAGDGGSYDHPIHWNPSDKLRVSDYGAASTTNLITTRVFRDPTAWMNLVVTLDRANGTQADRTRIYINGVRVTDFDTETLPASSGVDGNMNKAIEHCLGRDSYSDNSWGDISLAECIFLDGTSSTDASEFGEFDDNGQWVPVNPSDLTFGTNGWWLKFANAGNLGEDSANSNDWTVSLSGTAADHQITDSPTDDAASDVGNYAAFNPLQPSASGLSKGNTQFDTSGTSTHNTASSTAGHASGKFYFEVTANAALGANARIGVVPTNNDDYTGANGHVGDDADSYAYVDTGNKENNNSPTAYGNSYANGDRINVAVDLDNGTIWFGKDGTWQNSATQGEIEAGTTTNAAYTFTVSGIYHAAMSQYNAGGFALNTGEGGFTDTVPSEFLPWGFTADLPAPTVTDPSAHVKVITYTGDGTAIGSGGQSITGCQGADATTWTPDMVLIKRRDTVAQWAIYDVHRGANQELNFDDDAVDATNSEGLNSFDDGGFTVGSSALVNASGGTYVAYCFKLGGATSSNTDGSLTSNVSIASHGGIGIHGYTGGGNDNDTVGHGLGGTPDFYVGKEYKTGSRQWITAHSALANYGNNFGRLDTTAAFGATASYMSEVAPNSTVINLGTSGSLNLTVSGSQWAMCFKKVPGLVATGAYTGNGNADGPSIVVDDGASGFCPAFVIVKKTSGADDWTILDAVREPNNAMTSHLAPNSSTAESNPFATDFIANGFKIRTANGTWNASGGTYIYLAFAENPFGGDGVVQARAR